MDHGPSVRPFPHVPVDPHTDLQHARPLLGIMKQNVSLNQLESCVNVAELNWSGLLFLHASKHLADTFFARGEPVPADIPKPDLILAADCVYFEPAFPLLVQTLAELVPRSETSDGQSRRDDPEVLFCYKKRRKVRCTCDRST